ncbi:hypothetical protein JI735_16530 [Paenibacillus sonchi]|uniref:Uncharacterized protein n=1 Tax=Paenibacillus sonchi TaxID=373687 RepID=A0A974PHA7_9BACL|nr:hypothetical protein JI735_16530 [Paenibacillus sonchi]
METLKKVNLLRVTVHDGRMADLLTFCGFENLGYGEYRFPPIKSLADISPSSRLLISDFLNFIDMDLDAFRVFHTYVTIEHGDHIGLYLIRHLGSYCRDGIHIGIDQESV